MEDDFDSGPSSDRSPGRDEKGRPTRFLGKRKITIPKEGQDGYGVPPPQPVLELVPWEQGSEPDA